MDRQEFAELIKEITGELLEKHLASVHEEISDLRSDFNGLRSEVNDLRADMTEEFKGVRKEMQDGFVGLKSQAGALHNRIDNESFARKDLERRVRKVVPNLPEIASAQ